MIARGIDGLVMLICAFLIGWNLVPAVPVDAPTATAPDPVAVAPAPVPAVECPVRAEPAPAVPASPPARVSDPSGLPAVYLEIIGLPAR